MTEEAGDTADGAEGQTFKQTAKDLFSGAMGGIAQVIIGQPFDIVKVRLQTSSHYSSALDCATRIWKNEGPLAFYKGTLTPLIGIGACVSVQFGGFHAARRYFEQRNHSTSPLSYGQYWLAGAFAGITNTALSSPIEHVRIRLQTQPHVTNPANRLYRGPWSCIRTLVGHAGIANGLYRGTSVTLLREAQAYGFWFLTYEYLMAADVQRRNLKGREEVETWRLALYGGLAGEMLWISSYPFDVIKSKMQTDGLIATTNGEASAAVKSFGRQRYINMRDCFQQTWSREGMRGFWKGLLNPTLIRALPVSAATFATAELTMRFIS